MGKHGGREGPSWNESWYDAKEYEGRRWHDGAPTLRASTPISVPSILCILSLRTASHLAAIRIAAFPQSFTLCTRLTQPWI